ncbi:helix-turn-helix domain-containing protein [Tumebacillus lipolyticus]|uniref:Helix-turn-helix domain-containing protein n=1 Tax=Tumebacillus lipolyticus TaxID=1280370 RepID=A0ABW5A2Q4_9BACL
MKEPIGAKILKLRMRQGLTQVQLAKGICDRSHISMIEAGKCTPSILLLEKIAARLQLALPDLLQEVTPPSREASFSFDLLIEHIAALIHDCQYYDGSVLIRKHLRHPDIVESPSKMAVLFRYAGILEALKEQYERAEAHLRKAHEYAEECRDQQILAEVNISLGALKNLIGKYEKSEAIYKKLLSSIPKELPLSTHTKIYYGLGRALYGQGKFHQVVRILITRLDQLLKNNSMFMYGEISALIAACYEKMNIYDQAIPYYEKAVAYHTFTGNVEKASLSHHLISNCYLAMDCQEKDATFSKIAVESPQFDHQDLFHSSQYF